MTVDMQCSWQGDTGTFDENFTYADGKKERRLWTIKKHNDRYRGTAADVVGEAAGVATGNALNWKYVLALPVGNKMYHVHFDDWMWQLNDTVMMNRAVFSKFGFKFDGSSDTRLQVRQLVGQRAGPGLGVGPARVICQPGDLASFKAGEISSATLSIPT